MKIRVVKWPPKTTIHTIKEILGKKFIIPSDASHHPEILNIPQLKEKDFQEFDETLNKIGFMVEKI